MKTLKTKNHTINLLNLSRKLTVIKSPKQRKKKDRLHIKMCTRLISFGVGAQRITLAKKEIPDTFPLKTTTLNSALKNGHHQTKTYPVKPC